MTACFKVEGKQPVVMDKFMMREIGPDPDERTTILVMFIVNVKIEIANNQHVIAAN